MLAIGTELRIGLEPLEALGHGICLFDAELRIVGWNARLAGFGISLPEVRGRLLPATLPCFVRECAQRSDLESALRLALAKGETTVLAEVVMDFPTERGVVFRLCISPVSHADAAGMILFENTTEASRTREQYERILDSTPDGIFIIDPDRRVRLFNKASGLITGRKPEEILTGACSCNEVVHCHTEEGESYATNLCPAKSVFRGESDYQREEMMLTNANGEERWVETTYSAVRNGEGETEYVIGVLRDVHDRKMLEERLLQTEKLASFGQLVAGIAHEIKNPLAIMQSSLDVMENPGRPVEQRQEASRFIREEIRRLDGRLRSFLTFARPRGLSPRPLLLSGLVQRHVITMEATFPQITIMNEPSQPEPLVMADEEQLGQVLTNLVLNAVDAMEGKGVLHIRTRQSGDHALLEVEDTGVGIPEEQRTRVFDPFFTTKVHGTGLGLSICYQIVLAHGGTISVSIGRTGKGACFAIRLPVGMHKGE